MDTKESILREIKYWRDETRQRQQKMSESLELLIQGVESIKRMMKIDDITGEVQEHDS